MATKTLKTQAAKFAREAKFKALLDKAQAAGMAAAEKARPTPMVVGTPEHFFSDKIDTSKPTYYVADGVCGFAWVTFPGTTAFARWARDNGHARKAYGGGYQIWIRQHGQSYERKGAHAQAMAEVLREGGIKSAFADGRMD